MKLKIRYLLLITAVALIVVTIFTSKIIFNPNNVYLPRDSKSISYKVYLGIIPLGRAQITVYDNELYNGREVILIEAEANTSKIISKLFDARISMTSIVDPIDMTSLVYREVIWNRGEEESKIVYYDQEENALTTPEGVYRILPETHDPLSALFSLKNKVFKLGDSFDINVNSNQSNYGVKFDVVNEIESKNGKVFALKGLSQRRFGEKARHRVEFIIYVKADSHIPVLIKAFTPLGPIAIKSIY